MPPKVICGSPMTKICIFGKSKCRILVGKNAKNLQNYILAPNPPPSHLRSPMTKICTFGGLKKAHFGSQKWQNLPKLFLAPNALKSHLGVSHDQKCAYLGGQNIRGQKCKHLQNYILAPNPRICHPYNCYQHEDRH